MATESDSKAAILSKILIEMEKYRTLHPHTADVLLKEYEEYSKHFRDIDRKVATAQIRVTYIGQAFGFIIGITAIISGALTAWHGAEWAGAFIGGGGVIGLVSVFVLGRRKP